MRVSLSFASHLAMIRIEFEEHFAKKIRVMAKESRLLNVMMQRCPRCYQGRLFVKQNPYSFKDSLKMYDECPVCNQDFKIEPGFYIGALWTSFPIVIVLMALIAIVSLAYFKLPLNTFFLILTISLFLLQPIIVRLGRSIWIHIFVNHDPDPSHYTEN